MKLRLDWFGHVFRSLGAACALATCAPVEAAPNLVALPDDEQRQAVAALERASLVPLRWQSDSATGRVATLIGEFDMGALRGVDAARELLRRHATAFELPQDFERYPATRRAHDDGGETITFAQIHEGVPVFDAGVLVALDARGRISFVQNGSVAGLALATIPELSREEARRRAAAAVGGSFAGSAKATRLVVAAGDKEHPGFYLAWEVQGFQAQPLGDWHVFVSAATGEVVRTLDMLKRSGPACAACSPLADPGCGRMFFENPVDVLDDVTLDDASPVDKATQGCLLQHLTSGSSLTGQFVQTNLTANRAVPPYNYFRASNPLQLDEVTAYYHLDRSKQYLTDLGFPSVMNFSIQVDAHDAALGDSSHYVPSMNILEFGTGGVDDAQDPDVIYHEYGHAIQDNMVDGFGTTHESTTMGEGFGDYWAGIMTDDSFATLLGPACVASWDATAYNPYSGFPGSGCLRRMDGTLRYPEGMLFASYEDAAIWSAALWNYRGLAGGSNADAVVIQSHQYLFPAATFLNGADALLQADQARGGATVGTIHAALKAYGIPRTGTPASSAGITQSSPYLCESGHPYEDFEYRECAFRKLGALKVRAHFTSFSTETNADFVYVSDDDYLQVQRLSGAPFGGGGGNSVAVSGDTMVIRFRADPSIVGAGFTIDRFEYQPPPPSPAGRVPDGATAAGEPLRIGFTSGGELALTWGESCAESDLDYVIYEGSIGDFTSHTPRTCTTDGLRSWTLALGARDAAYYLVVPRSFSHEGSYGKTSAGIERPVSGAACVPQDVFPSCP